MTTLLICLFLGHAIAAEEYVLPLLVSMAKARKCTFVAQRSVRLQQSSFWFIPVLPPLLLLRTRRLYFSSFYFTSHIFHRFRCTWKASVGSYQSARATAVPYGAWAVGGFPEVVRGRTLFLAARRVQCCTNYKNAVRSAGILNWVKSDFKVPAFLDLGTYPLYGAFSPRISSSIINAWFVLVSVEIVSK